MRGAGRRTVPILAFVLGAGLTATLAAGCSKDAREKILPIFFDAAPAGQRAATPPTRRVRRDLLREIDELKRALADAQATAKAQKAGTPAEEAKLPVEKAKRWEDAAASLPRDATGAVDWIQALEDGAIAPRPSPDPKAPVQAVLDLDLELTNSASRVFRAVFRHASHTAWLGCGSCHPAIFPLGRKAAPTVITMADIQKGQYCGACHGSVAFGVAGRCGRCHRAIPARTDWRPSTPPAKPIEQARTWSDAVKLLPTTAEGPDWTKALAEGVIAPRPGADPEAKHEDVLDVDVVRAEGEPTKVVFPHAVHTAWLVCDSCHPEPFRQAGGTTPMSMDDINSGKLCGVCHGKVAFPVDACGRCHPAIGG